jgi:pantoate--beta-alanine ligase
MAEDLNFPVTVMGFPTVRESDGLAMSSRNGYLSSEQRQQAPALYASLQKLELALREGKTDYAELELQANKDLEIAGFGVDYVAIRRASDLGEPRGDEAELVVLASAWLGKARLIDNIPVILRDS